MLAALTLTSEAIGVFVGVVVVTIAGGVPITLKVHRTVSAVLRRIEHQVAPNGSEIDDPDPPTLRATVRQLERDQAQHAKSATSFQRRTDRKFKAIDDRLARLESARRRA